MNDLFTCNVTTFVDGNLSYRVGPLTDSKGSRFSVMDSSTLTLSSKENLIKSYDDAHFR